MSGNLLRKYGLAAGTALVVSCCAHLLLGWLVIYPFGPKHPDVPPWRLFQEDILEATPWMAGLFTFVEVVALAIAGKLVARASLPSVLVVAGAVPALVLVLFAFRIQWVYLDTPTGALTFFFLFVFANIGFLYAGIQIKSSRGT